jgi:hypothetical protein
MKKQRSVLLFLLLGALPLLADSNIPLAYIPRKVVGTIEDFVPGAQLLKCEIGSDDDWGNTYKCDYLRHGHKGKIKVSQGRMLLDLDEDLDPSQLPPRIRRVVSENTRGGLIRKARVEEDEHHMIYKIDAFYGQSSAKVKLKITRQGEVIDRDYD